MRTRLRKLDRSSRMTRRNSRGFTLLELMIVISICYKFLTASQSSADGRECRPSSGSKWLPGLALVLDSRSNSKRVLAPSNERPPHKPQDQTNPRLHPRGWLR